MFIVKIYIVTEWFSYEGATVIGAFSTPNKAQAFIDSQELQPGDNNFWGYHIEEIVLDNDLKG